MSSDMSDNEVLPCTPPEITAQAKCAAANLLPAKSRERYEGVYRNFMDWRLKNKIHSFSENVLMAYFEELSNQMKPSSLWAIYSMLRSTIVIHNNINIAEYSKLQALLKRKSDGFQSKKSKILSANDIKIFLQNAPNDKYLFMKVVLVIDISGACRKQELRSLKLEDIEDTGKSLIVTIRNSKNKTTRSFVVSEKFYGICKQYINLRPSGEGTELLPFFVNYQKGKCTRQCVGINKFGSVPSKIAEYLGLSNPKQYTGHCFRRSSATILVDAGGDLLSLKRHGGWRSSAVAEGYVDNSLHNKTSNAVKITSAIENMEFEDNTVTPSTSVVPENNSVTNTSILVNNTPKNVNFGHDNPSLVFNNCTVTINNNYYYGKNNDVPT